MVGSASKPWNFLLLKKTGPLQWHCEVLLASVAYQLWGETASPENNLRAKVLHLILSQSAHGHFIHLKCFKVAFFAASTKSRKYF